MVGICTALNADHQQAGLFSNLKLLFVTICRHPLILCIDSFAIFSLSIISIVSNTSLSKILFESKAISHSTLPKCEIVAIWCFQWKLQTMQKYALSIHTILKYVHFDNEFPVPH